jgi:hypothetical protein
MSAIVEQPQKTLSIRAIDGGELHRRCKLLYHSRHCKFTGIERLLETPR